MEADQIASPDVLLGFVGDVFVDRADPLEAFAQVRGVLKVPRILFGNLEGAYADNPRQSEAGLVGLVAPARNLDAYAQAGFNVMSLANNHVMDAGYEEMLRTRSRLRAQGIKTCGAGDSLQDAREPAIIDVNHLRVAFLAYASTFPMGCEARQRKPGLVPMRAYNSWQEPFQRFHAPGLRPYVTTVPDEHDLAGLTSDIHQARAQADLVIVSFHWGDHTRSFYLTDHEIRTARYCVDQGAHLVVGHHHHALRGMEWYKGRPIMYGLGHLVFDFRFRMSPDMLDSDLGRYFKQIDFFTAGPPKGWPLLPMPADARLTLIAWARAGQQGISDIGFLPCTMAPDGVVHPVGPGSPKCKEVVDYLDECNRTQGLRSRIVSEDSEELAGFPTLRVVPN